MDTSNASKLYDLAGATGEILIMLLVAFALGVTFGYYLLREPSKRTSTIIHLNGRTPQHALPPSITRDNLKIVEGVGSKVELLLNGAGIYTLAELSKTPPEKLREILETAGGHFSRLDPVTWPSQAAAISAAREIARS